VNCRVAATQGVQNLKERSEESVQNLKERSEESVRGLGERLKVGGSKKGRFGAKRKFINTFGARNQG